MYFTFFCNILDSGAAFTHVLITCVMSERARALVVVEEGIDTLNALCSHSKGELDDMVSGINKAYKGISRAAERCSIGAIVLKRLHAVRLWAKDALIEGQKVMLGNPQILAMLTQD